SSRRRHTRFSRDWSSDVCSSDLRRGRWYTTVGATGVNLANYPDNPKPVDVTKYKTIDRDVVVMRKTEAVFNQLEALYHINPALRSEERRVGKEGRARR